MTPIAILAICAALYGRSKGLGIATTIINVLNMIISLAFWLNIGAAATDQTAVVNRGLTYFDVIGTIVMFLLIARKRRTYAVNWKNGGLMLESRARIVEVMRAKPPTRVIMRIELTPAAKELLTDMCIRNGMTQVTVMSRITEWFSNQDQLIQGAILGHYPATIESDVAKIILKKMAG